MRNTVDALLDRAEHAIDAGLYDVAQHALQQANLFEPKLGQAGRASALRVRLQLRGVRA